MMRRGGDWARCGDSQAGKLGLTSQERDYFYHHHRRAGQHSLALAAQSAQGLKTAQFPALRPLDPRIERVLTVHREGLLTDVNNQLGFCARENYLG